jgi:hypothetical protein
MEFLAQSDGNGGSAILWLLYIAWIVLYLAAGWIVYTKAGQEGWKSLIPIYNWYVLMKIIGRPGWWWVLLLIPFVNIVIWIIVSIDLAKSFGKGTGFALGLIFLSPIFYLILAFGPARYVGPAAAPGGAAPPPMPPAPA